MSNYIRFKCPYCGIKYARLLETDDYARQKVVTCETEDGGCNQNFAIEYYTVPHVTVYKLQEANEA